MAAELMIVNPRRRRKRTRTMSALQRKYFGRRRARVTRARRNPRRRSRRVAVAPVRRRRIRRTYARRNPIRRRVRRLYSRRNPRSFSTRSIGTTASGIFRELIPATAGAAGALALDMAWGYLPIPSMLSTGMLAPVTRIAGALGIGYLGGMVAGKKFGNEMMVGAVTVTLYDLVKGFLIANDPALFGPVAAPVTTPSSTGMYVEGLGYVSPAQQVGAYVSGLDFQDNPYSYHDNEFAYNRGG